MRAKVVAMAIVISFASGWLMGADYPPPSLNSVSATVWIVGVAMAGITAILAGG